MLIANGKSTKKWEAILLAYVLSLFPGALGYLFVYPKFPVPCLFT